MRGNVGIGTPNALILQGASVRGWVPFSAGLGVATKRKILVASRNRTRIFQLQVTHYTDSITDYSVSL
jgi:hypothetical protein